MNLVEISILMLKAIGILSSYPKGYTGLLFEPQLPVIVIVSSLTARMAAY